VAIDRLRSGSFWARLKAAGSATRRRFRRRLMPVCLLDVLEAVRIEFTLAGRIIRVLSVEVAAVADLLLGPAAGLEVDARGTRRRC
jgi:hypothetical protein